jgi:hypothetical protein
MIGLSVDKHQIWSDGSIAVILPVVLAMHDRETSLPAADRLQEPEPLGQNSRKDWLDAALSIHASGRA